MCEATRGSTRFMSGRRSSMPFAGGPCCSWRRFCISSSWSCSCVDSALAAARRVRIASSTPAPRERSSCLEAISAISASRAAVSSSAWARRRSRRSSTLASSSSCSRASAACFSASSLISSTRSRSLPTALRSGRSWTSISARVSSLGCSAAARAAWSLAVSPLPSPTSAASGRMLALAARRAISMAAIVSYQSSRSADAHTTRLARPCLVPRAGARRRVRRASRKGGRSPPPFFFLAMAERQFSRPLREVLSAQ
mmetsp:Transcript_4010/g.13452  ORF Transcript_4010/g.13452 Transcript_4010/m.13452 type:complete len:255 (-) Transcript_4010:926-1690(-)